MRIDVRRRWATVWSPSAGSFQVRLWPPRAPGVIPSTCPRAWRVIPNACPRAWRVIPNTCRHVSRETQSACFAPRVPGTPVVTRRVSSRAPGHHRPKTCRMSAKDLLRRLARPWRQCLRGPLSPIGDPSRSLWLALGREGQALWMTRDARGAFAGSACDVSSRTATPARRVKPGAPASRVVRHPERQPSCLSCRPERLSSCVICFPERLSSSLACNPVQQPPRVACNWERLLHAWRVIPNACPRA